MITTRRSFLHTTGGTAAAALGFPVLAQSPGPLLGQGAHQYRVVPGWGQLGADTPVKNCHGIVEDAQGHIILLTDHTANNVIVYDTAGKLVHKWGTQFPGAHGLSLVREGQKELLYITDLQKHCVTKTTLDGQILQTWGWPDTSGKYTKEASYKPSWTLHRQDGSFYVLDGYGQDYILHYDSAGKLIHSFGGAEGGITHWGPHGGLVEQMEGRDHGLIIAMSDQQHLLRLSLDGTPQDRIPLPGGNPRQIRQRDGLYYVAHLADNWPKDRASRGFVSVLDKDLRVLSNLAGSPPEYNVQGVLGAMKHQEEVFTHPHDLCPSRDGSIYVAQFASGNSYPIKLEPA
jgi:peptidylamidoglycolate lyase